MIHQLRQTIELPISLYEAWSFFSNPKNLTVITPPELGIRITSEPTTTTYAGQIITYTISPIFRFPMLWVTKISHVDPPYYFVDEQLHGPYQLWHHQHRFCETPNGTRVDDLVDYILPGGVFGDIVHAILVKRKLRRIFDYRSCILLKMFPSLKP